MTAAGVSLQCLPRKRPLASPQVGLRHGCLRRVDVLRFRELSALVGRSDRGILINAVAGWVPDRIRRLVCVDVSVPRDGESNNDVC
jgi:hypothetical protein